MKVTERFSVLFFFYVLTVCSRCIVPVIPFRAICRTTDYKKKKILSHSISDLNVECQVESSIALTITSDK